MKIINRNIGANFKPYIIAEMSGNHNQSLELAFKIVEEAKKTGVDAIKLQTYTADTMTLNINKGAFFIKDKNNLWRGRNLYKLYNEAHTPWDWHHKIFEYAKKLGLTCFSSPFDESAVDFLEKLGVPAYKIASFENIHIPLIQQVAKTKKPIIISTGMATVSELNEAVSIVKEHNKNNLALLKCTSNYPANPKNTNLKTIPHMKELFNCEIGLSDHTLGIGVSVSSIAFGTTIIEKHFTLDRSMGGVDSKFSLEPKEMKQLVFEVKQAWQSIGKIYYGPTKDEKNSLIYRRSIYASKNIKKNQILTKNNIKVIRPGDGLHPRYWKEILGKKASTNIQEGKPIKFKFIKF